MQNLVSLGHAATLLQLDVPTVKRALEYVRAEPTLILNGVPHFLAEEVNTAKLAILGKPELRLGKAITHE
jgi:hypothetical protein